MTVSNNTAMVHLSNALNVPNFSFQGNVNLSQWHPYIKENLSYVFNHLSASDFYRHYKKQIEDIIF